MRRVSFFLSFFSFFPKKEYTPLVKICTNSISFSSRPCQDYPILHKRSCLFILHFHIWLQPSFHAHHLHSLSHMPCLSRPSFNYWEGGTTIWVLHTSIVYPFHLLRPSVQYTIAFENSASFVLQHHQYHQSQCSSVVSVVINVCQISLIDSVAGRLCAENTLVHLVVHIHHIVMGASNIQRSPSF